jgi:signal transduction histidine kinase
MALPPDSLWRSATRHPADALPGRGSTPQRIAIETESRVADEALAELAGSIAHDLNNLLDVISKLAALQIRGRGRSRTLRISHQIEAAVQRAAKLTHRLFGLDSVGAERIELPDALAEVADFARASAGENIVIKMISEPRTWPVTVNASDLQRAVLNLAINSVQAMPGGGTIVITTFNTVLSDQRCADLRVNGPEVVEIRVADSGRGMTPDTLSHAFEPHFTTKLDRFGAGLGLSQVQAFIHRSGGALQANSSPGVGTTISLYLPSARLSNVG